MLIKRKGFPYLALYLQEPVIFCMLCLTVPAGLIWIFSQFEPMFVTRYFLPYSGLFYLLLAYGVLKFPFRLVGAGTFMIILLMTTAGSFQIMGVQREANWKEIYRYISTNWQEKDVLLITPPSNWIIFDYYNQRRIPGDRELYELIYSSYPASLNETELMDALTTQPVVYQRLWLVNETGTGLVADWKVDPSILPTFLDSHFYRQPIPDSLSWKNCQVFLFRLEEK